MVITNFHKNQGFILNVAIRHIFLINFFILFLIMFWHFNFFFPTLWDLLKIMVIITLHENENSFLNIAFDKFF
jgi:hypothetical protein